MIFDLVEPTTKQKPLKRMLEEPSNTYVQPTPIEPIERTNDITIDGGPLAISYTEKQDEVFSDPHRFILFAKGRRFGGTIGAANYVIESMLQGSQKVLWVDTIQGNLVKYFQRYFAPTLKQINREYWSWNETKKELKILDSYLDMRSAERPENLEGFGYTHIILNEAGIILKDRYLWDNAIRPMTLDYRAKCFFVGTPKGKRDRTGQEHLYYTFFKRGLDPVNFPDWKSFTATSYENPFLTREDIEDLEKEVPAVIARQEIHAEFIDVSADAIFKDEWWQYAPEPPKEDQVLQKIISLDTAFKDKDTNDFTAGIVWQRTYDKFYIVDLIMERLTFPDLITRVEGLYAKWLPDVVLIEDKASGQSLIQMFQRTTLPVVPYKVDTDKVTRAIAVTPLISQGKVVLVEGPWNKTLVDQCAVFPNGEYDDLCFVAGTLVATPSGDKPIEALKIGDSVLTPVGIKKITRVYVSSADVVVSKFGLTGTPNHPILCGNKFERMDALTQTLGLHILGAWKTILWYLTHKYYLKENPTSKLVGKAIITTVASIIPQNIGIKKRHSSLLVELWKRYTMPYGRAHTINAYLQVMWYTILMVTQIIMILVIYNSYRFGNMVRLIKDGVLIFRKNILKISGLSRFYGTVQREVWNGIETTLKKCGWILPGTKKKNQNPVHASSVVQNSCHTSRIASTAPICALKNTYTPITTKESLSHVGAAINPLKLSIEEKTLLHSVPSPAGPLLTTVYNIEVDYAHCYYANKILVGNCDALSMGLSYQKNYVPVSSVRVPVTRKIVRSSSANMRGY